MSKFKLKAAQEFLQEKKYEEARIILNTISDNPTAQEWITKLNEIDNTNERAKQKEPEYKPITLGLLVWFIRSAEMRKELDEIAEKEVIELNQKLDRSINDMDYAGYSFQLMFVDINAFGYPESKIHHIETDKGNITLYLPNERKSINVGSITEAKKLSPELYYEYRNQRFQHIAYTLQDSYISVLRDISQEGYQLVQFVDNFLPRFGIEDSRPTVEYKLISKIPFLNRTAIFSRLY